MSRACYECVFAATVCIYFRRLQVNQHSDTMDVFNAPSMGSPRALASRSGNTAGTSTDIVYPTSRIVNGAFQSGKTLEFNWRSDKHRHVLLRSSRPGSRHAAPWEDCTTQATPIRAHERKDTQFSVAN